MNTESSSQQAGLDLQRRVRMHAALGDSVRLGIADRLTLGDVSPGKLADAFGLPSNLLAHHLRVLQEAGIVRRVRSEGDRRRSYVQLVHEDPAVRALVAPALPPAAARVVFVCTKNSARSQIAAAAWLRVSQVPTASAGTHPAARVHPRAISVGRRHGLRIPRDGTRSVVDVVETHDLVVAVCDNAHEELAPQLGGNRLHWAVPDPVAIDTDVAFEAAYQQITARVEQLAGALATAINDDDSGSPR